jgi:hypothetical protein
MYRTTFACGQETRVLLSMLCTAATVLVAVCCDSWLHCACRYGCCVQCFSSIARCMCFCRILSERPASRNTLQMRSLVAVLIASAVAHILSCACACMLLGQWLTMSSTSKISLLPLLLSLLFCTCRLLLQLQASPTTLQSSMLTGLCWH